MESIQINGDKTLTLSAPEVGVVLDALAALPYGRVAGLVEKIFNQVKDRPQEVAPP